jgi:pilus assembly protein TadC
MEPMAMAILAPAAVLLALLAWRSLDACGVELPELALDSRLRARVGRLRRLVRRLGRRAWLRRLAGVRVLDDASAERAGAAGVSALVVGAAAFLSPAPGPLLAPVLAIAVVRAPSFLRARAGRRRQREIDAELPQFLDALAAASNAGLSAPLAIRRAAEVVRGPLHEELRAALNAADLGSRWRDELRDLANRVDLPDLRRTVAVITRTETLGASLSTSTIELAGRVRSARRQRTTERARTAPVKMLFPLVFLVLPAFLLLTVVPVLLTTMQSIR